MNAYYHAKSSMHKWGGNVEDYLAIHEAMDSTKASFPDMRHRAILHHSTGIYLVAQMFGTTIDVTGQHGYKQVPSRLILERHVIEDLGRIPTPEDYLNNMKLLPWMAGAFKGSQQVMVQTMPDMEEILERYK
jgi:hypothetical protein